MSKLPTVWTERLPLKDTSKHFINTNNSSKKSLQRPVDSKNENPINYENNYEDQQQAVVHLQKLNTSDKAPQLMGTSTPKKDGYLPYLTNTNVSNNLNTIETSTNQHNNNTISKKMTGNELSKWQQTWREILPRSFIYFEQDESNERDKRRAIFALKRMGATIEPFFCENVTIIISKRNYNKSGQYPKGDIFKYAVKKQLKVWTVEKVFRFLNHLGETIPNIDECDNSSIIASNYNNNNNNNLSNLLMNERIFGPSDRDPNVRRNDFKYFTCYYLYIWDFTHKTRPVAIREWKDKYSYPRMHHTTNGKSLFVPESKITNPINLLKRHQRRLHCLANTLKYRQKLIESSYIPNLSFEIRHPDYNERVSFKRNWEECYYKSNTKENPHLKYKLIYDSLNKNEKEQFADIFPNDENDENNDYDDNYDINSIDNNEYLKEDLPYLMMPKNKRQKYSNIDGLNDNKEKLPINNSETDADDLDCGYNDDNNDETNKINNNTPKLNENNKNEEIYNDDNVIKMIDDDNDGGEEEKILVEYNEINKADLSNLVSDKSDIIDRINNPLINDPFLIDNDEKNFGINHKTKSPNPFNLENYENPSLNKMPKLMREDSIINTRGGQLLCEYGEIAASGIQASGVNPSGTHSHGSAITGIGNGLGPSKSQVVNKILANEQKRIVVLTPTWNNKQQITKQENNLKNYNDIKNKNNCGVILIADDTISETQDQILGYKDSSNKNTINEDELAALRSVEAANPILSDDCANKLTKNANNTTNHNSKHEQNMENVKIDNLNASKKQQIDNTVATVGVFKDQKQEKVKCEMKPGYCENCRVKYADFPVHVLSDKHRSFAENSSNFKQIDELIECIHSSDYFADDAYNNFI